MSINEEALMKWLLISHGLEADEGQNNCTLCQEYSPYNEDGNEEYHCMNANGEKCPIYIHTKKPYCENTPYGKWKIHQIREHENKSCDILYTIQCNECIIFALNEALYLYKAIDAIEGW